MPDEGGSLAPDWNEAGVAERFLRDGWRSRLSSWYGYEEGTCWCEVELDAVEGRTSC
jgi:hypothetical protein